MISKEELKVKLSELVLFAQKNLSLKDADFYFVTNSLLDLFKLDTPAPKATSYPENFQEEVMDKIIQYALENNMIEENEKIRFETRVFGLCSLTPSATIEEFTKIAHKDGVKAATDWFFNICKNSNYIRVPDINKNIKWTHTGSIGEIGITINLSKPEKDPKQIALEKSKPKTGYPACMLCIENVGFAGNVSWPARQTLRTIPITLNKEDWSMQYSPYQYFNEHLIALCNEHRPMNVTKDTFVRLVDFTDIFPYYFLGSNASLPIVGGSILAHDHYQGGDKVLPMFKAKNRQEYKAANYSDVRVYILDWYNSVVHIESENKENLLKFAGEAFDIWQNYSDESVGVLAKTTDIHNAVTPIARKEGNTYVLDLILRNNRTDDKFPDGIFHAAPHLHHIKKEGIGLIEAMGLFILPARLKKEFEGIKEYLEGKKELDISDLSNPDNMLAKHKDMIVELTNEYGFNNIDEKAELAVKSYVNKACEEILECTAVFKNTSVGQAAFDKFMQQGLGLKKI